MYKVQSVIFKKSIFTPELAIEWLKQNGYKVKKIDETKKFYRFRQITPTTLRKNGFTHFITQKLDNSGIELILAYPDESTYISSIEGGFNPFKSIANSATYIKNLATGKRDYPAHFKEFLNKHGNEKIVWLEIERVPVSSAIQSVLNVISLGQFNKNLEKTPYDKLFHLSINITTDKNTFFKIEKNESLKLSTTKSHSKYSEFVEVPITSSILVIDFLENGRKRTGDENFFVYSAQHKNCQEFVNNLLIANFLDTPALKNWITQDTSVIFENLGYLRKFSNIITDTYRHAKGIITGEGHLKGMGTSSSKLKNPNRVRIQNKLRMKIYEVIRDYLEDLDQDLSELEKLPISLETEFAITDIKNKKHWLNNINWDFLQKDKQAVQHATNFFNLYDNEDETDYEDFLLYQYLTTQINIEINKREDEYQLQPNFGKGRKMKGGMEASAPPPPPPPNQRKRKPQFTEEEKRREKKRIKDSLSQGLQIVYYNNLEKINNNRNLTEEQRVEQRLQSANLLIQQLREMTTNVDNMKYLKPA